ncbi:MAG: cobalt transporter, partial [Solirubrobacteraceae bacterium]
AQAATALIALIGASSGLSVIDPIATLVIAGIAAKESAGFFRGEGEDCCAPIGFAGPSRDHCGEPGCDCC